MDFHSASAPANTPVLPHAAKSAEVTASTKSTRIEETGRSGTAGRGGAWRGGGVNAPYASSGETRQPLTVR